MTRGTLTVTVTPSKKSLASVTVNIEVEDIENVMKQLNETAPGVQLLDLVLRIARRF